MKITLTDRDGNKQILEGDTNSTLIGSLRTSDSLYNAMAVNTCGTKKATMSICVFIVL